MKYLGEWIAKNYKDPVRVFYQLHMGDLPHRLAKGRTDVNPRWYYRFGPRADAVVITKSSIDIIETESRRPMNGVSELLVYRNLAPATPELHPFTHLPIRAILVAPVFDKNVWAVCREHNIIYKVYHPGWMDKHLRRWGVIP